MRNVRINRSLALYLKPAGRVGLSLRRKNNETSLQKRPASAPAGAVTRPGAGTPWGRKRANRWDIANSVRVADVITTSLDACGKTWEFTKL
jgi:hypothetical protein